MWFRQMDNQNSITFVIPSLERLSATPPRAKFSCLNCGSDYHSPIVVHIFPDPTVIQIFMAQQCSRFSWPSNDPDFPGPSGPDFVGPTVVQIFHGPDYHGAIVFQIILAQQWSRFLGLTVIHIILAQQWSRFFMAQLWPRLPWSDSGPDYLGQTVIQIFLAQQWSKFSWPNKNSDFLDPTVVEKYQQ